MLPMYLIVKEQYYFMPWLYTITQTKARGIFMGYILKETPHPPPSTRGVLEGSEDRSLGTHE
jgi:hypothetical protein